MGSDKIAKQLAQSLAFVVEAIPQKNSAQVKTTDNLTPLSVKIRIRKKHEAGVLHKGVISIPKLGQPDSAPHRIRLASSDQTIMSFNMTMEADDRTPLKKARKPFFGGCFGSPCNDDESPYLPSSPFHGAEILETKCNKSEKRNMTTENNGDDLSSNHNIVKKKLKLFGKCKPGGCLDPPFGEDKYKYERVILNQLLPRDKDHKLSNGTIKIKTKTRDTDSLSSEKITIKTKPEVDSLLNIYQYQAKNKILQDNDSDSLITYPPEMTYDEQIDERNPEPKRKISSASKLMASFTECNAHYFSPQKKNRSVSSDYTSDIDKFRHSDVRNKRLLKAFSSNEKLSHILGSNDQGLKIKGDVINEDITSEGIEPLKTQAHSLSIEMIPAPKTLLRSHVDDSNILLVEHDISSKTSINLGNTKDVKNIPIDTISISDRVKLTSASSAYNEAINESPPLGLKIYNDIENNSFEKQAGSIDCSSYKYNQGQSVEEKTQLVKENYSKETLAATKGDANHEKIDTQILSNITTENVLMEAESVNLLSSNGVRSNHSSRRESKIEKLNELLKVFGSKEKITYENTAAVRKWNRTSEISIVALIKPEPQMILESKASSLSNELTVLQKTSIEFQEIDSIRNKDSVICKMKQSLCETKSVKNLSKQNLLFGEVILITPNKIENQNMTTNSQLNENTSNDNLQDFNDSLQDFNELKENAEKDFQEDSNKKYYVSSSGLAENENNKNATLGSIVKMNDKESRERTSSTVLKKFQYITDQSEIHDVENISVLKRNISELNEIALIESSLDSMKEKDSTHLYSNIGAAIVATEGRDPFINRIFAEKTIEIPGLEEIMISSTPKDYSSVAEMNIVSVSTHENHYSYSPKMENYAKKTSQFHENKLIHETTDLLGSAHTFRASLRSYHASTDSKAGTLSKYNPNDTESWILHDIHDEKNTIISLNGDIQHIQTTLSDYVLKTQVHSIELKTVNSVESLITEQAQKEVLRPLNEDFMQDQANNISPEYSTNLDLSLKYIEKSKTASSDTVITSETSGVNVGTLKLSSKGSIHDFTTIFLNNDKNNSHGADNVTLKEIKVLNTYSQLTNQPETESIIFDFVFHNFPNDNNKRVIKTLEAANSQTTSNVVFVKTTAKRNGKEIRIPIDHTNDMSIQIKQAIDPETYDQTLFEYFEDYYLKSSQSSGSARSGNRNDSVVHEQLSHTRFATKVLQETLSSIYETELIPLQNIIRSLKKDVDLLAGQRVLFRDKLLGSKRRLVLGSRRCVCLKK